MPTKKNISLRQEDIQNIKELRSWIETEDNRLSLAEVVRRALLFSKNRKIDFIDALHN